jgi:ubiquinone/menaquinone biosynthesis C-methylase UbiE
MHDQTTIAAFTAQAEAFNASSAANDAAILDAIVELAAPAPGQRWLEAACGPGVVSRRLAPRVASVHGFDLTPAMVDVARREARQTGLENLTFELGDATELPVAGGSFDGAVTRFSAHHIPLPVRLFAELARVVKRGGAIVVADHLADADRDAYAWSQELERLRDPSHWLSLTLHAAHQLADRAGLAVERELIVGLELDFDDWLARGHADEAGRALAEQALAARPAGADCFEVVENADGTRTLRLRVWAARLLRG